MKRLWQISVSIASMRLIGWLYAYYSDYYRIAIPAYGPVDPAIDEIYASRGHHLIIGVVWSVILLSSVGMLLRHKFKGRSLPKPHYHSQSGCSSR